MPGVLATVGVLAPGPNPNVAWPIVPAMARRDPGLAKLQRAVLMGGKDIAEPIGIVAIRKITADMGAATLSSQAGSFDDYFGDVQEIAVLQGERQVHRFGKTEVARKALAVLGYEPARPIQ